MAKKGLGKGLGAIFGEDIIKESENEAVKAAVRRKKAAAAEEGAVETVEENPTGRLMVKVALIEPNKEQPRVDFNEEQMAELAESIKKRGVLQPLLVQKKGAFYEIIAGERRWRAAKMAGLKEVPVVVGEYSRQESMEIALIENVQRADLNPIEEGSDPFFSELPEQMDPVLRPAPPASFRFLFPGKFPFPNDPSDIGREAR